MIYLEKTVVRPLLIPQQSTKSWAEFDAVVEVRLDGGLVALIA